MWARHAACCVECRLSSNGADEIVEVNVVALVEVCFDDGDGPPVSGGHGPADPVIDLVGIGRRCVDGPASGVPPIEDRPCVVDICVGLGGAGSGGGARLELGEDVVEYSVDSWGHGDRPVGEGWVLAAELVEFVAFDDVGPVFEDPVAAELLVSVGESQRFDEVGEPVVVACEEPLDDVSLVGWSRGHECIELGDPRPDRGGVEGRDARCTIRQVGAQELSGGDRLCLTVAPPFARLRGRRVSGRSREYRVGGGARRASGRGRR